MEMRNKIFTYFIAIVLAALVVKTIISPELMIAPGQTIDAHSEVASDCFACHTPFIGSRPAKCIACHKVDEIGLITTKGLSIAQENKSVTFHQKLIEEDCVACHSDHKGVQAFRPIGQFSHQLIEPAVIDQCNDCHSNPGDALHQKIEGNCGSCHVKEKWTPATFDHKEYFRFDKHHRTECETCHIENDYGKYTCYGCHEHSRSKIREEHVEEGIYEYEICVDCHRSGDEHEAERIWRSKRGGYNRSDHDSDRRRKHDDDDDDWDHD
jgi:hypothetical protein